MNDKLPYSDEDDDLFNPSLTEYTSKTAVSTTPPWNLDSLFWIAFFGGATAIGVLAWQNGQRLNLKPKQQQWVLIIAIVGVVATLIAAVTVPFFTTVEQWQPVERGWRLISRIIAVLAYLGIRQIQTPADRLFKFTQGDKHESLWGPGLRAVIGWGIIQNLVVFTLSQIV